MDGRLYGGLWFRFGEDARLVCVVRGFQGVGGRWGGNGGAAEELNHGHGGGKTWVERVGLLVMVEGEESVVLVEVDIAEQVVNAPEPTSRKWFSGVGVKEAVEQVIGCMHVHAGLSRLIELEAETGGIEVAFCKGNVGFRLGRRAERGTGVLQTLDCGAVLEQGLLTVG